MQAPSSAHPSQSNLIKEDESDNEEDNYEDEYIDDVNV